VSACGPRRQSSEIPQPRRTEENELPELLIRREGPIGTVVFSNPEKYNAMSYDMWRALPPALAELDADPSIRLVVLEGAGDKAFVSGADISQFESSRTDPQAQARYNASVEAAYQAPVACSKPVIAKIRGICMGGGLGLAAACDLRICSSDARFRMPAGRLGLGYNLPGVRRFTTIIGVQNTYDIFFSARIFGAEDALRMGFVTRVTAAGDLDAAVSEWTAMAAENAPLTLRALKRTVNELIKDPEARDQAAVDEAIAACFRSDDYREGARAFMEKRKPDFKGR
jgi:enoyl-CoA hydratase/carnithine racemase